MTGLARWCFRHRLTVIAVWAATLVAIAVPYLMLGTAYDDAFDLPGMESTKAQNLLRSSAPTQAGDADQIVIHTRHGSVQDPAVRQRVSAMLARVAQLPSVASVDSMYAPAGAAQISPDKTVAYATVTFDAQADRVPVADTTRVINTAQAVADADLEIALGGGAVSNANSTATPATEYLGILAAGIILFLAFGTLLGMLVPLVVAIAGVGAGMLTIGLLSHLITLGTIAPTVAALIGLGVGIDYALFIVVRYRTGLQNGLSPQEAAVRAQNTSGRAVLFAGGTVIVSLLGMLILRITPLTGIGLAAVTTVLFTVLAAVTLLPALFALFGTRLITRRQRRRLAAAGHRAAAPAGSGFWERWARLVGRRKAAFSMVALVVIAVLSAPVLSLRLGSADAGNDPAGTTTRTAYDLLADGFGPGSNGPLVLVAPLHGPGDAAALNALTATVRRVPGIASVQAATATATTKLGVIEAVPTTAPQDQATSTLIDHLRHDVIPAAEKNTSLHVYVGGYTATNNDFADLLTSKLPLFLAIIVALGCLLLMVAFRSVVIPLTAAAMNLLASAASFGVVVAVFQWGMGTEFLGAGGAGPVEAILPVIMLAILFGLSMDYQVFLVSRMHEEWQHTSDNQHAVRTGQATTGRMITAAALIMICVFTAFVLGGQRTIAEFGVGLATAVAIDAFVLRTVLVPALMHLFGNANWWLPAWLDRILPHISIEGVPAPSPAGTTARSAPPAPVVPAFVPPAPAPLRTAAEKNILPSRPTEPAPYRENTRPHRKSPAVAYLWWLSLGLFGAHHFYLGRTRWGWLYLATAGIGGLGWLADPFLIPRQVRTANACLPAQARTLDPTGTEGEPGAEGTGASARTDGTGTTAHNPTRTP
ncbi:MMPL family transporter [Streptomyces sp. NPDC017991]|uniref:MMPL family transporter n=1 Tax=Streptomyces sp. NPDC017991 TaxID=3365026 RepID=UPI0037B81465